MDFYFSFTEHGNKSLPGKDEIIELKKNNVEPVLFLDSCVCLNIIKIVDYKKKATNANIQKVVNLKRYISENHLRVRPLFGLIELSYNKGEFDIMKFWDFRHRIQFFESIPIKHFLRFKYDFYRDYYALPEPKLNIKSMFAALDNFFLNAYCSLLKIRAISLNGLSKDKAENNIAEFYNWMTNELGIILGIEYRLALNIFGGSTEFRKMIWLDGKESKLRKKLLGTAWDIFHTRISTNNFEFAKIVGDKAIEGYFITNDNLLFNLHANYSLTGIIDNKSKDIGTKRVFNTDLNLPHLGSEFIDANNRRIINDVAERFNKPLKNTVELTKKLILELEKANKVV